MRLYTKKVRYWSTGSNFHPGTEGWGYWVVIGMITILVFLTLDLLALQ